MDKCRYCGLRGLVLSTINADYSCEHCGEWQDAELDSAWIITGYKEKIKSLCLCAYCNCDYKLEDYEQGADVCDACEDQCYSKRGLSV